MLPKMSIEKFTELIEDDKIREGLEDKIREAYKDSLIEDGEYKNNTYLVTLFEDGSSGIDKLIFSNTDFIGVNQCKNDYERSSMESIDVATFYSFNLDTDNTEISPNYQDCQHIMKTLEEELQKVADEKGYATDDNCNIIKMFREEPTLQPIYKEVFEECANKMVEQLDTNQYIDDTLQGKHSKSSEIEEWDERQLL